MLVVKVRLESKIYFVFKRGADFLLHLSLLFRPFRLSFEAAYKYADGRKIDGRRVVVDVERGRTVKSWRPRKLGACVYVCACVCVCVHVYGCVCVMLGGGLGGTRKGAPHECIKHSGRVDDRLA